VILAHKIALDPTTKQRIALARAAGVARFAWNWSLAEWDRQYKAGEKPTAAKLKKRWNAIKGEQFPWVYDSPKGANQQPFANLQKAFSKFFKKTAKRPTFKRKGEHDAFYVENDKLHMDGRTVVLPVIGRVRIREELRFFGKIMGAVVSRTAERWFVSVQVEIKDVTLPRTGDGEVGIDLGLTTFATISTGEKVEAPMPLRRALCGLRRAQRKLSRRKKGSKRREKMKRRVARMHRRVSDVRNDWLHKLSTRICRENQAVAIEDLNVRGMAKNRCLARSISDAGWGEFRRQLTYKAARYGTRLAVVGRWEPTSKTCSGCGHVKPKLGLSEREYFCEGCGLVIDRDVNAAINICTLGLRGIHARGEATAASNLVKPRTKPCMLAYTT